MTRASLIGDKFGEFILNSSATGDILSWSKWWNLDFKDFLHKNGEMSGVAVLLSKSIEFRFLKCGLNNGWSFSNNKIYVTYRSFKLNFIAYLIS